jgi:uncharacterized protein DUF4395
MAGGTVSRVTEFVRGQGFPDTDSASCSIRYPALMFQPRLILVVVLVGIITQSALLFLVMSLLLAWNALLPRLNPFDRLYPALFSRESTPLVAPPPRRFAQSFAAVFMTAIGLLLLCDYNLVAWLLEGALVIALLALVFGNFCLGSSLYLLIRGTLPKRS